MARVVDSYQCEWQTTLNDPDRLALFRSFVNSDVPDETVHREVVRDQPQLAAAPEQSEGQLPWRPWQVICDIAAIPEQAGIGARLGERQSHCSALAKPSMRSITTNRAATPGFCRAGS